MKVIWNWNDFERFEVEFDSIRGNLLIEAGIKECSVSSYYTPSYSVDIPKKASILLEKTEVVTESSCFLSNSGPAKVQSIIATDECDNIPANMFTRYQFRYYLFTLYKYIYKFKMHNRKPISIFKNISKRCGWNQRFLVC